MTNCGDRRPKKKRISIYEREKGRRRAREALARVAQSLTKEKRDEGGVTASSRVRGNLAMQRERDSKGTKTTTETTETAKTSETHARVLVIAFFHFEVVALGSDYGPVIII